MDWWPTSLYVNTQKQPYNNKDFRWALSYLIDRDQLIKVGWNGASEKTAAPDAELPGPQAVLRRRQAAAREVPDQRVQPREGRRADVEARAGRRAATACTWTPTGQPFKMDIIGRTSTSRRSGPVLRGAAQARRASTRPSRMPPDMGDRLPEGRATRRRSFGHGGSIKDPFETLRLYQSNSVNVPGRPPREPRRSGPTPTTTRSSDEVYVTPPTDKEKLTDLFVEGDGDLAAGAAGHPVDAVLPPAAAEHDLLDGLPDPGRPVHQPGLLPLDRRRSSSTSSSPPSKRVMGVGSRVSGVGLPSPNTHNLTPDTWRAPCALTTSSSGSAIFLLIVWVAATLNFFIPRLGSRSPIEDKLMTQAADRRVPPAGRAGDGEGVRGEVRAR